MFFYTLKLSGKDNKLSLTVGPKPCCQVIMPKASALKSIYVLGKCLGVSI